ncbi:uncharacterized protein [Rutidosis leptorrhynchoides]|uniref:uncharacterized protein isoform X2 n=1 Tax=Rutidosis leptorrhynchoides TaxID=125765 RepID=UPI003A9A62AE
MGRPPSNGGPTFRFTQAEIAEMESILQAHKVAMPERQVLVSLAEKFSNSEERVGKMEVQMKQVWNWFQNRRYAIRAKASKSPGKLDITQMPQHDSGMIKVAPQPTQPLAASSAVRTMPQVPQHPTVPLASVRTFPQAPQHPPAYSGRVTDNSQMEYEAKSARDGAWYDVSLFLSHRGLDTGDPEVLVRFAGFGAEEDEWVNVRKNVRQRSLPCESSECVAVLPADLILCFQEGKEQALYFDAHVLDAQRRRHDVRGCRCRFLVRYDHDQSEEIVALRKICRRPETDYRLQQLHAVNESSANQNKNGATNNVHTVNTLRVYPPAEVQPKQHKVEPPSLAETPQKRQRLDEPGPAPQPEGSQRQLNVEPGIPAAPPGYVPQNQHSVQPAVPAPSVQPIAEPQKVDPVIPSDQAPVPPTSSDVPHELQEVQPMMTASSTEGKPELQKVEATVDGSLPEASDEPKKAEPVPSAKVPEGLQEVGPVVTLSTEMLVEPHEGEPEPHKETVASGSLVEIPPKLHEVQSDVLDQHHTSSPETKTEEPIVPISANDPTVVAGEIDTKIEERMVPVSANDPIVVEEAIDTKTEEPMVPVSTSEPNVVEVAIEAKTEEPAVAVSGNDPEVVEETKTNQPVTTSDPNVIDAEIEQPKLSESMEDNEKGHAKVADNMNNEKVENAEIAPANAQENEAVAMEEG